MLVLNLCQVKARVWRGYTKNRSGWLPKRMSWMEPGAATDFEKMNEECGYRIEYLSVYRSTVTQIQAIAGAPGHKRRLYAPPTKSGHNFAFSVDVAIEETLENFRKSRVPNLVTASRDRQSLGRWIKRHGWTGIKSESWHFNHLGAHETTVKKIEALYGHVLILDNDDVQRALNRLVGKELEKPLEIDGMLGTKSSKAAVLAGRVLNIDDQGDFSPWFRRVLAGATVGIKEVAS